jgi:outer membrane protein assembly factor BamB
VKKDVLMKNRKFLLLAVIIGALFISSCARGLGTAQNWPGVAANVESGLAYLAFGDHVYYIDLENGRELGRFPAEGDQRKFFASPALTEDGSQLIVGDSTGVLYSLDALNSQSEPNWTFPVNATAGSGNGGNGNNSTGSRYIAGSLIQGDQIFAPVSNGHLYALDLEGSLLWEYNQFTNKKSELWATPALDESGVLYLPSMDHLVYAIDSDSGDLLWKSTESLGGALPGTPALNGEGKLFAGTLGSQMVAVDTNTSAEVSNGLPANGWIWSGPVYQNGILYYGDLAGKFYAFDTVSSETLWTFSIDVGSGSSGILGGISPQNKIGIAGSPLIVGDSVYFVSENSQFYALDKKNGTPLRGWPVEVGGSLYTGPVLAGETLLVAQVGADDLLTAYDLEGKKIWSFRPAE